MMKSKILYLVFVSFVSVSCGNKSHLEPAIYDSTNYTTAAILKEVEVDINERTCIDELLTKELEAGESIRKLVVNADINFCNGVRVRLKTYRFSSKKYKAYGFVQSNSGHKSCIKESDVFSHTPFLGDRGVLLGDDVKILLGAHQFNSDNLPVPSEHKLARFVRFDWETYKGEMAFFEKGKLRCWAIQ